MAIGNSITSMVQKVSGTLQATFDDNTTRTWNIARQRTFTGVLGQLVMTVDGFGTEASYQNLVVWGTDRQGETFYSQITQSVVHKEVCDGDPCSGIVIPSDSLRNKMATITYGYDNNNHLITNGDCPTKYKLDWQNGK